MEERLKQRLVGAVVLVSLAVVLVPILFDLPPEVDDEISRTVISEIPERPRDGFGSSAGGDFVAPETPRLDDEVERERNREASRANAQYPGATVKPASDDSTSSASSEVPSEAAADASEPPASEARSEQFVTRPDTASAASGAQDGPARKPAAETSAAGGWTVQLGSFRKFENALALHKRLQARGYTAFVESGSTAQGNVSRVFVGPMPDREQAKSSAAKLQRELELEGLVVPYRGG